MIGPMRTPIFEHWKPEYTEGWNRRSMNLPHTLHRDALFGIDALAALIDHYRTSA
jgi:hypothetical protein